MRIPGAHIQEILLGVRVSNNPIKEQNNRPNSENKRQYQTISIYLDRKNYQTTRIEPPHNPQQDQDNPEYPVLW